MSGTNRIPEEKIRQAFDLFLSLRGLNQQIPEDERSVMYSFDVTHHAVGFWVFEPVRRGFRGAIKRSICIYEGTQDNIDDLIDKIEEELDATRSQRNEQADRRD